ncbi:MAG: RNA 3'-terminal phosphate cyclase [Myxococcales bacterium]|nr:RNA 3'-terminal phosphate cyclase [Myxococcales bacterium]
MQKLVIDGSQGEGGGQILRSSLTLAAITQTPLELVNIRARRSKPGLLRQHLTAVRAAAAVCGATVEGAELGSRALSFQPGPVRGGYHAVAVGSAGSTTLVCQTVLPILVAARQAAELEFSGGTHNPLAPPYDFLEHVYFPLLRRMGVELRSELLTAGFHPAGGGRFRVSLGACGELRPLELLEAEVAPPVRAWTLSSRVPVHVAERELGVVREGLGLTQEQTERIDVDSPGPGNALCVRIGAELPELVTAFGEKGRRAEEVAGDAVRRARAFLEARVPVGEHLADQLIVMMALAGGAFRTGPLSSHTRTNVDVVRAWLGDDVVEVREEPTRALLRFTPRRGRAPRVEAEAASTGEA